MNGSIHTFILLVILFLASCALEQKRKNSNFETVNVPIDKSSVNIDGEDQLSAHAYGYGPKEIHNNLEQSELATREPVIALHLAPAGYHMAGYISLLRSIEQQKIKIAAISGEGLSSVLAALYAKYNDSNRVEWKLYSMFGRLQKVPFYSIKWKEKVQTFLEKEFENKKEHQLRSLLLVPLVVNDEVVMTKEEPVEIAVMSSLNITGSGLKAERLSSLLSTEVDYKEYLTQHASADIVFQVGILPENFNLKGNSGYQYGIYSKKVYLLAKKSDVFYQLDYLENPIDEIPNIGEAIARTKKSSDNITSVMLKKINDWKNVNKN